MVAGPPGSSCCFARWGFLEEEREERLNRELTRSGDGQNERVGHCGEHVWSSCGLRPCQDELADVAFWSVKVDEGCDHAAEGEA